LAARPAGGSGTLRPAAARFGGIVGAQGLEFAPQDSLAQRAGQALDPGQIQMLAADRQAVAFGTEGHEIQAEARAAEPVAA
jgi:hypothetical protein